eukprot:2150652-Rhodomonas_salina.1
MDLLKYTLSQRSHSTSRCTTLAELTLNPTGHCSSGRYVPTDVLHVGTCHDAVGHPQLLDIATLRVALPTSALSRKYRKSNLFAK